LLTPLVGIYELRLGDAHLPSGAMEEAFELVGIDRSKPFFDQGFQLLCRAADALWSIGNSMYSVLNENVMSGEGPEG